MQKFVKVLFCMLVIITLSGALWVGRDFLFPYVTTKAFFFRIIVELAFPIYVYLIVADRKLRPNLKNPLTLSVLAFLIINIVSSFTGVSVIRSLFGNFERMGGAFYIAHLVILYFYVLALGQMQGQYLQNFLKGLLFVAFVLTGNGIFGWLGLPTFVQDPSLPGRVSSTLGNPIYLGSFLIIPLFIALFFMFQAEKLAAKIGYGFLALMFLWGVFLSGTRGAVVGLIIGSFICGVVYLFLTRDKRTRNYGLAAGAVFVALFAVLFIFGDKLPQGSILKRISRLQDSNSAARIIQWKIALKGYKDRPFLGTGPENYYVVGNLHYNPEIFKYDRSWFDKPHNYLIEILVTNGILGLLAYLSLLVFIAAALFRGYRAELYGLAEFCVLLSALLVYQIQNLFVFDTVPASLTFYTFVGFAGYLWSISGKEIAKEKNNSKKIFYREQALPLSVSAVVLLICAYGIYAGNVMPLAVAKNVNYGFAYSSVDPVKANDYFNTAISLPFNFDKTETASKYGDFATSLARAATKENQDFASKVLDQAAAYMRDAITIQPDNPILWERLATLYLYKNVQVGNSLVQDPRAEEAINKAIALAPKREEAYLTLGQIRALKGDFSSGEQILRQAIENFPTDTGAKVQLSNQYRLQNRLDEAVKLMEQVLDMGYNFGSYGEINWLVSYYAKAKQFDKAIALLQQAGKIEPNNVQIFIDLAKLYAATGQTDLARNLAKGIINFDATKKIEMQALLDSLPQSSTTTP